MAGRGSRDTTPRPDVSFGAHLRRLREKAGLTQEELASRAGLTPHAVSALERGQRKRPYPHTVRSLAGALGLSEDERVTLLATVPKRDAAAPKIPPPRVPHERLPKGYVASRGRPPRPELPSVPRSGPLVYFRWATYRVVRYPLTMRPPCSLSIRSEMPRKRRSRKVGFKAMWPE